MEPIVTGAAVFACLFGMGLLGMRLRAVLPQHHLSAETKDSVRVAMGLVATMAALVLGLLVAAAKGTYDVERTELTAGVANIKYLDGVLEDYGPEAQPVRELLRRAVAQAVTRIWPSENAHAPLDPSPLWARKIPRAIQQLSPQTDLQRQLKSEATELSVELGRMRALLSEQTRTAIPPAIMIIVVVWMATIFLSLGIFAPSNATTIVSMASAALSVACAIFLILELSHPFSGIVRISSEPFRNALGQLAP